MTRGRKKICWVIASPLTIRFFFLGQIAALSERYEMTVITNTDDPCFLANFGIPARLVALPIDRDVSFWRDLRALFKLFVLFRREKFDLVHTLSPKTGLLGTVAAWMAGISIRVHVFQGEVWATKTGLWRLILKNLDKLTAMCATHLLVVSTSERQHLAQHGIAKQSDLVMLANGSVCGVDLERFRPDNEARSAIRRQLGISDNDQIVLYVGRLNSDKGVLDLAQAFSLLAATRPDLHLLMVGPDEGALQDRITISYDVFKSRLHFVGYTPNPERYMAAADLLCLPSYREGFGMVLIEAAAVGLPTVASRIYGITDAVRDGETGFLFKPAEVTELTQKLQMLLDDPGLRARLGASGQQRVKRDFSSGLVQSALLALYQNLLNTNR